LLAALCRGEVQCEDDRDRGDQQHEPDPAAEIAAEVGAEGGETDGGLRTLVANRPGRPLASAVAMSTSVSGRLFGRRSERAALDQLISAVRAGESQALVVCGEAGVGKSALLGYAAERAAGCRVVHASGVEAEMELAFAGLHQLCTSLLDRLERLPAPQHDALATAFGLRAGEAPDRFLVSLAVLSLLGEAADDQPLICLVDDAQWLDRASAQVLAFVARRLLAESVALVFGTRERSKDTTLRGLPDLVVEGLGYDDARTLLESVITGPLDDRIRDRIIAETAGNPLALIELPRGRNLTELAGGYGLSDPAPLAARIEQTRRGPASRAARRRIVPCRVSRSHLGGVLRHASRQSERAARRVIGGPRRAAGERDSEPL
jgi:AAA ATPase domain